MVVLASAISIPTLPPHPTHNRQGQDNPSASSMADAEAPDPLAPAPVPAAPELEAEPEVPEDPSEVVRHLTGLSKDLEATARVCMYNTRLNVGGSKI